MNSNVVSPLDSLKIDQHYHVYVNRDYTGQYDLSGQLTKGQYLSLDGCKIKTSTGKVITGKRWIKAVTDNNGYTYMLDRVYLSIGCTGKQGYSHYKLGHVYTAYESGMQADSNGNRGVISLDKVESTTEEIAFAIQEFLMSIEKTDNGKVE